MEDKVIQRLSQGVVIIHPELTIVREVQAVHRGHTLLRQAAVRAVRPVLILLRQVVVQVVRQALILLRQAVVQVVRQVLILLRQVAARVVRRVLPVEAVHREEVLLALAVAVQVQEDNFKKNTTHFLHQKWVGILTN